MLNSKLTVASVLALAGIAALVVCLLQSNSKLRDENLALRNQQAHVDEPPVYGVSSSPTRRSDQDQKPGMLAGVAANSTNAAPAGPSPELLRLRGEVAVLRTQAAETAKAQQQQQMMQVRLHSAKQLCTAFAFYALDHQEQFPTNFSSLAPTLADAGLEPATVTNLFEIVYQGKHDVPHPEKVIVIRERESWAAPQGGWYRTYGFADNHSELHYSADGDFTAWENEHRPKPVAQ